METVNRFQLEKYKGPKTRHTCPACGKRAEFARIVDTATGEYVADHVGRCNRETNCGYNFTVSDYFKAGGKVVEVEPLKREFKHVSFDYIPLRILTGCMASEKPNNFETWLKSIFPLDTIKLLKARYNFGTFNKPWNGGTVFFYLDEIGRLTRGPVFDYCPNTGKKKKYTSGELKDHAKISSVVTQLKLKPAGEDWNYKQSLFGAHLLKAEPGKVVALVESEKTAIIASAYFPKFLWLATGGKGKLTLQRAQILKGRKVVCFPDMDGLSKWNEVVKEFKGIGNFIVSDFLNANATEDELKHGKLDLCDYLIRFPLSDFIGQKEPEPQPQATVIESEPHTPEAEGIVWDIAAIENFFRNKQMQGPVQISNYETIVNPALFVERHLDIVKANFQKHTYTPYYDRLLKLQTHYVNS